MNQQFLLRNLAALFALTDPRRFPVGAAGSVGARVSRHSGWLLACIVLAGAAVRFWGLGAVGLHGDEKTMALPVMSLVNQGLPLMPSGMFYPRAVGQLYLMAASVMAFGQSEWSMRVPSALCGLVLIVLTWQVGKRFLIPGWNLALTAAVAFLPSFIEDAQTARMYVFLITSVAGYMALIFAWERTGRAGYLAAAVVAMLVGLQFHTLAVFAAFLVFLPGILQGDRRKLWTGVLAFAAIALGFELINHWISSEYPLSVESDAGPVANGPHAALVPHLSSLWLMLATVPALAVSLWILAHRGFLAALVLAAALVAGVALAWHMAALLGMVAFVLARRNGVLSKSRVGWLLALSVAVAGAQAFYLVTHAAGSPEQIVGVMLGWPSVWPFIALAKYSMVAALAVVGSCGYGLWLLAHRKPVPDHLLLLFLGVWIPLLMIGWIKWNIPPRYAAAQIIPLLVAAFAAMQWAAEWTTRRVAALYASPAWGAAVTAAALACVLVVDPMQLVRAMDSGYATHPDHKGAARFVASLHPGSSDIIVAEDVLQQTYYLGHVDYWLVNKQVAAPFMHRVNGRWLDFYTDTPLIGTGVELERLVERPDRGAIYVIGSGENQEDGRSLMRAFGISEALQSPSFRPVYLGRDGLTRVWKVDAPAPRMAQGR